MNPSLLPADSYIVINKSIITEEDKKILNRLYLPITGPLPIMLYNILVEELDKLQLVSEVATHAKLLSNLHLSANELSEARNVLEGIGLLKTYLKTDTINNYIYELYSPVSAHEFFSHPIFNIVLYNNVGKKEYEKLKESADDKILLSYKYTPDCMKKRNEFMVKSSSALVSYVRREKSGSKQTLKLAKKYGLMVIEL